MASGKGILLDALGGLLLRSSTVKAVRDVSAHFRAVELTGPALRGVEFHPGTKVQVLLPDREVRTFTPLRWDSEAGETELLVYHHAASPAGNWIREVEVGDPCRFVGPQRSLRLPDRRPVVLFGDETSCAVARAFAAVAPDLAIVLETSHEADVVRALGEHAAQAALVARSPDDSHLARVLDRIQAALERHAGASLLLTGRAQAIQGVRAGLKARSLPSSTGNRAYWSLGKRGLD
jgi:NADPH-dependent ferric siderophore reductase